MLDRRGFLELVAATLASAGATGCTTRPRGKIVPYVEQPRGMVVGTSLAFSTCMSLGADTIGLLVESRDGRPIKIEGHPEHPASLGAAGTFAQASILDLYNPARARSIREGSEPRSWKDVVAAFSPRDAGRGLHVLMEPTSSPLIAAQLSEISQRLPEARIHFHAADGPERRWAGSRLAFGRTLETRGDVARARVMIAIDADFLGNSRLDLSQARAFADARRVRSRADDMNRLYVVETPLSITGAKADHRLAVRPSDVPKFVAALLLELDALEPRLPRALSRSLAAVRADEEQARFAKAVARDLADNPGAGLVMVGGRQPPIVHALCHAVNELAGNTGSTVRLYETPLYVGENASYGIDALASALERREVTTLVVLEGNPVHAAPAGFELGRRFRSAGRRLYLGAYENETARACQWFVPAAHYLESWGDAQGSDGTVSFAQPLIEPLFGGRTAAQVLATLLGNPEPDGRELLRAFWARNGLSGAADWEAALRRGHLTAPLPEQTASCDFGALVAEVERLAAEKQPPFELWLKPDDKVHDGRFADNAWLQELPDPITQQCWGNAALLSPRSAAQLGVRTGDVVELRAKDRSLSLPALVLPGHADQSVTLNLGYGTAAGIGENAWQLVERDAGPVTVGIRKTGRAVELAIAQPEMESGGRHAAHAGSLHEYRAWQAEPERALPMLYFRPPTGAQQWAMSIDLTACTGCSACVVACQAENNIPVVGRDWVLRRRQMHWIRIDRYFEGTTERPRVVVQPMLCQHCEKAPCEYVCPVNATTHSPDGLNEMTYNRCVGTRFCSNNCPYKVRRFNYLDYESDGATLVALVKNPDVTVRSRGVMEKCTYCVQRIRKAEAQAAAEKRPLDPRSVVTACAQACPTRAIVFGSLTDGRSEVALLRDNDLTYQALSELGTRPRTTYLKRLENPNPELDRSDDGGA